MRGVGRCTDSAGAHDDRKGERIVSKSYEDILEASLPNYLKKDIVALEEGRKSNSSVLDCLYCEVQGSINSAYYDNEITKEQAALLRKKYLFLEA